METPEQIRRRLLANADPELREFGEKIIVPGKYRVVGIRTPVLKAFAKDICNGDWRSYLDRTEDEYHEDMGLRGSIIAKAEMDDAERFDMIIEYVPKIDNWALCDSFCSSLKVTKKNSKDVWKFIIPYLDSKEEFLIRFPIAMMVFHFVDGEHVDDILKYMDTVKNDAYYVKMAVAWCVSLCFVRFPDTTMRYLENNTLDKFTFNKALSKITDSFRVSAELKEKVRAMRRK